MTNTIHSTGFHALITAISAGRAAKGWTMREFARKLNCHVHTVANIEHGQRRIDVIELIAIARVLELDPEQLFGFVVREVTPDELTNNFNRKSGSTAANVRKPADFSKRQRASKVE